MYDMYNFFIKIYKNQKNSVIYLAALSNCIIPNVSKNV